MSIQDTTVEIKSSIPDQKTPEISSESPPPIDEEYLKLEETFEEAFSNIEGEFRQTAEVAKNAGVDISSEKEEIGKLKEELDELGEEVREELGIRERLERVGSKARSFVQETYKDRYREPRLKKQFEKAGFTDPEKALEVVAFLEENLSDRKLRGFDKKHKAIYEIEPYRCKSEDLEKLRKLTQGVDNPVKLLQQLSKIIYFKDSLFLDKFAYYFETIKNNPRLPDLISRLSRIQNLDQVSSSDLSFSDEGGNVYLNIHNIAVNEPDVVSYFLNLNPEEYERIVSDENISRLNDFVDEIKKKVQLPSGYEKEDIRLIHLASLPTIFRLASDETLMDMWFDSLADERRLMYGSSVREIDNSAKDLLELTEKVPELVDLYENHFNISDYIECRFYCNETVDKRIRDWGEKKDEFRKVLENEQLIQNTRLLFKYAGIKGGVDSNRSKYYDFYRTADSEKLEKILIIWCGIGSPRNENEDRIYAIHDVWRNIGNISLDLLKPEDLKDVFVSLPTDEEEKPIIPIPLYYLFVRGAGGWQEVDGQELKKGIKMIANPEYGKAVEDNKFMETVSAFTGTKNTILRAFENPDDFFAVYEKRDKLIERSKLLEDQNRRVELRGDMKLFRRLIDFSDEEFSKFSEVLQQIRIGQLTDKAFEKANFLISLENQEIDKLIKDLEERGLPGIYEVAMTPELVSFLLKPNFFETFDELDFKRIFYGFSSRGFPYKIILCSYLSENKDAKEVLAKFAQFSEAKEIPFDDDIFRRSEKVKIFTELFLEKRNDEGFRLDDYIDSTGKPTLRLINKLAEKEELFNLDLIVTDELLGTFSEKEKNFWQFWLKESGVAGENIRRKFLLKHQQEFFDLVVDGVETKKFYQLLAEEEPNYFVDNAGVEQWRTLFGEQKVKRFLQVLSKATDERRNAFTHNEYDRTSQFIRYLMDYTPKELQLDSQNFEILTEYVSSYGLAKTPQLFHYFKQLYLFEQQKITELPEEIKNSGITTIQELENQLNHIRELVYTQEPIDNLSGLSEFEVQTLKLITGKGTHRFDNGRPSMEQIMRDFEYDFREEKIAPLPEGYKPEAMTMSGVEIEFDVDEVKGDYEVLKNETLSSIDNPQDVSFLKERLETIIEEKVEEILESIKSAESRKKDFMESQIQSLQDFRQKINEVENVDDCMGLILEMHLNLGKAGKKATESILRQIVFRKVFEKHYSPGFIHDLKTRLEGEISPQSLLGIINVVDNLAKAHALNLKDNNEEGYWREDIFEKLKSSKKGKKLPGIFSPHFDNLKKEVENFKAVQLGNQVTFEMIPDRGFVGEMSGYLGDACYTAVYPLLVSYPNVIPYKFIVEDPSTEESGLVGSVLVFELEQANGDPVLLVRAFNIPQEQGFNMEFLVEGFLDRIAKVAKARRKKRVLVPGLSGTISNYPITTNHINQKYVSGKSPISLVEEFTFNGYDLTNKCFVAREIEDNDLEEK